MNPLVTLTLAVPLAWAPAPSVSPAVTPSPATARVVAAVLCPDAPHARAILAGLAEGLGPAGYRVVRPALPRRPTAGWRGTTDVLTRLLDQDGIRVFVVGPERDLCHLALQFSVKAGVRSILIGCPDDTARLLPVREGHHVAVPDGGRTEDSWRRAALAAARLVLDLEYNPPGRKPSPFRRR